MFKGLLSETNGHNKTSFGRVGSLAILIFWIGITIFQLNQEYVNPTGFVDVKVFNEQTSQVITISERVPNFDWAKQSDFVIWGILPLLVALYPASKATTALQEHVANKKAK